MKTRGFLSLQGMMAPSRRESSLFGHDQVRVEVLLDAEAEARGAGAVGVVEGEHGGGDLRVADAAVRTGELLAEDEGILARLHLHDAAGLVEGQLDRLEEAPLDALPDGQPVDDHVYLVLLVLVEDDLLAQVDHLAVQLDPA